MLSRTAIRSKEPGHDIGPCPVTIAGAGNPLLSCDRIGSRVLSLITNRYGKDVELWDAGTNGLSLLDILHRQDLLIVVDACFGEGPPGRVAVVDPATKETVSRGASIHQIGPVEALLVGRYLYPERMPQRLLLITVDTNGLTDGEEEAACQRAIQSLDFEIGVWRAGKALSDKENDYGKQ